MCNLAKEIQYLEDEKASLIRTQSALLNLASSDSPDAMSVETMDKITENTGDLDAKINGISAAIAAYRQELKGS